MAMDMEMFAATIEEKDLKNEMTFRIEKDKSEPKKDKFKGKAVGILGKLMKLAKAEKQTEDKMIQEMHPINHTILRIVEKPLLINLALFGLKNP